MSERLKGYALMSEEELAGLSAYMRQDLRKQLESALEGVEYTPGARLAVYLRHTEEADRLALCDTARRVFGILTDTLTPPLYLHQDGRPVFACVSATEAEERALDLIQAGADPAQFDLYVFADPKHETNGDDLAAVVPLFASMDAETIIDTLQRERAAQ